MIMSLIALNSPAHFDGLFRPSAGANNSNNFNTIDSRKHHPHHHNKQQPQHHSNYHHQTPHQNRKYARKSSMPAMHDHHQQPHAGHAKLHQHQQQHVATVHHHPNQQQQQQPSVGLCRTESVPVVLDCSQGSGLVLGARSANGRGHLVVQVLANSAADRSGCIFTGDLVLSINKLYNLEANIIRQILGDQPAHQHTVGRAQTTASMAAAQPQPPAHWVELEIEFSMADSVIPASGVFNVKLAKLTANAGLGITVNGTGGNGGGTGGGSGGGGGGSFVITEVKPGSPAHRTGSLRAGDILLAVDAHQLQPFNVDALLKENRNEFTTLTIKRNSLPDFLFDAQQRAAAASGHIYTNVNVAGPPEMASAESIYGGAYKSSLAGMMDGMSFKAQSCQPELYASADPAAAAAQREMTPLMGTQMRRPFLQKAGSADGCGGGYRRTATAAANEGLMTTPTTMTTEADVEKSAYAADEYEDGGGEFHQRNKRLVLVLGRLD